MSRNRGRLRRERMIIETLVHLGERGLGPGDPAFAEAMAALDTELAGMGLSPPTMWELDQVHRAEVARLEARLARNDARLAEMRKLARHAKAMGLRPGQRVSVVYDALGIGPGDPVPEPGPVSAEERDERLFRRAVGEEVRRHGHDEQAVLAAFMRRVEREPELIAVRARMRERARADLLRRLEEILERRPRAVPAIARVVEEELPRQHGDLEAATAAALRRLGDDDELRGAAGREVLQLAAAELRAEGDLA